MGTLVLTLEMNKTKGSGITVTIANADDEITQTIQADGTTLTLTVKGPDATSTITQKQDSIAIVCNTFTLNAETIACTSTKGSTYTSGATLGVTSSAAMTVTSGDIFDVTSAKALTLTSSDSLSLSSVSDTTVSATGNLSCSGQAGVKVKGATVAVNADGSLDMEASGIATLKGSVTNVQGNLVNLG